MYVDKQKRIIQFIPYVFVSCLVIVIIVLITSNNSFKDKIKLKVGETLEIKEKYSNNKIDSSSIEFYSSDPSIVEIDKNTGELFAKKSGEATITIKSKENSKTLKTYIVDVNGSESWIKYDQDSYTCNVGEVIDTMIRTGSNDGGLSPHISSYKSSNTNIATIESGFQSGIAPNCSNCVAVHITCKNEGTISLTATSETGVSTKSTLKVSRNAVSNNSNRNNDWIKYDKASYTCKKGQVIDTMIRTGSNDGGISPHVTSYKSSNTNIATIESGFQSGITSNCSNCAAVHITCKNEGTVSLTATSDTGATTKSELKVEEADKGWIKYSSSTYTCREGEIIDTMIKAGSNDGGLSPHISSYKSSNTNIATIESGFQSGITTNCSNCAAVHIKCKSKGTVTLTATSDTGVTTKSELVVEEADKGWIKYDKTSYTCKKGQVIDTMIRAGSDTGGLFPHVSSYKSGNTNIATIESGFQSGITTNCSNCAAVHITCKEVGTTSLTTTSSTGVTATVKITVNN